MTYAQENINCAAAKIAEITNDRQILQQLKKIKESGQGVEADRPQRCAHDGPLTDEGTKAPSDQQHRKPSALTRDEQRLALWKAIGTIKIGLMHDDKLILANLWTAGFVVARADSVAMQAQQPVAEVWVNDPRYLKRHSFQPMVGIENMLSSGHHMLYAAPVAAQAQRIVFPSHLRRMWSGTEVQEWLDVQTGTHTPKPSAKGSLERYRQYQHEQAQQPVSGADQVTNIVDQYADLFESDPILYKARTDYNNAKDRINARMQALAAQQGKGEA